MSVSLAGSHGAPAFVPPTQLAPFDSTTGPAGLGKTIVGTLLKSVVPIRRVTCPAGSVDVPAGTNVTPAPDEVVIDWSGSVPPPPNTTVRVPPGSVNNPFPPLADGSKHPFSGTQGMAFSIWLLVRPVIRAVRVIGPRKTPVRKVPKDVTTGSGGLFDVSTTGMAVPLVITILVTCEPTS